MSKDSIDYPSLWRMVEQQFLLDKTSIHGPAHWRRVEEFGLKLASHSGADVVIVRLFSVFHDSCRWDDGCDPGHGRRGGQLARETAGKLFALDSARLEILVEACNFHADGKVSRHPTIGTCWDADRLDLARCGICPRPEMLSTELAREKETIKWAVQMKRR
jgi:uncharacterized protein